ncbi:hypothetical protein [Leucobacter luti]|uniref:hypothetical protein n=1 Tax=Leucobacter luti TaxID=340320 RepID=UPI001C688D8B|nr:hypothetical protein [Leucobacter luti]QYM74770.1 hypothetical protein K1X41_08450 [Leucobacter luti]
MERTRALRMGLGNDRDFHRFDVHAQRVTDLQQSPRVRTQLNAAEIQIESFAAQPPLRIRIARFSEVALAHARVSELRSRWNRGAWPTDRALLMIVQHGSLSVTGPDGKQKHGRGAFLMPPGPGTIHFATPTERTDFVCMSVPARITAAILSSGGADIVHSAEHGVAAALFAPTAAYISSVCGLAQTDVTDGDPLQHALEELAHSVVRLAGGDEARGPRTLYGSAIAAIRRGYDAPSLNPETLALTLGVSVRTLQSAFRAEGRTVAGAIRQTRAAAAVQLRHEHPHMPQSRIAALTGFGSVDSLQRAMQLGAAVQAPEQAPELR